MCLYICVHNNNIIYLPYCTCSLCWWLRTCQRRLGPPVQSLLGPRDTNLHCHVQDLSTAQFSTAATYRNTHTSMNTHFRSLQHMQTMEQLHHIEKIGHNTHWVLGHCAYINYTNITQYVYRQVSQCTVAHSQQVACSCHIAPLKCSKQMSQST